MSTNLPAIPEQTPPGKSEETSRPEFARTLNTDGWAGQRSPFSLRRYLQAVYRYKWLVLLVAVLGAGAGFGASRLIPPEYQVQATVWVHQPSRNEGQEGPIRATQLVKSSGWVDLLNSYVVLDPVVEKLGLYLKPAAARDSAVFASFELAERVEPGAYRLEIDESGRSFALLGAEGEVLQRDTLGEPIGAELGFRWTPAPEQLRPGQSIAFRVQRPRDVSKRLMNSLDARLDRDGNFLGITLRGSHPERAARLLNAILERYVEVAAELKRAVNRERTEILEDQLDRAERALRSAESDLQAYRVRTITLPSEPATPVSPGLELTQDPVLDNYFDMKIEEEQLRRDREALERVLESARDSELSLGSLEVIPVVKDATELQKALEELRTRRAERRALRYRYADDYPPIQRLNEEIRVLQEQTIPALTRTLIAELRARQAELQTMIRSASTELRQIPARAIEEARLERRVATAEEVSGIVRQRYEEARLATASTIPDVRILDAAMVPQRPVNAGDKPLILLAGTLMGLGLGLVGAIVFDGFDPRVRYPEEINTDLGLPILGTIPHLTRRNGSLSGKSQAQALEAFRNVRLNLTHAYGTAAPLVVTVTSPGAEEGKSLVTFNLAHSFAELKLKTLIIDGDLRQGSLHNLLDRVRRPGLTDYLSGKVSEEEVVQETDHESLHFVGGGRRLQAGPELLQSSAMSMLLNDLRSAFDVILVDSPPLAAGVDPFVLGTLTGNVLLVVRSGTTNRELADAKLDLVDRLPIRILGAVLNDVPGRGVYRYYYSYLPGYESRDEEEAEDTEAEPQIAG